MFWSEREKVLLFGVIACAVLVFLMASELARAQEREITWRMNAAEATIAGMALMQHRQSMDALIAKLDVQMKEQAKPQEPPKSEAPETAPPADQ